MAPFGGTLRISRAARREFAFLGRRSPRRPPSSANWPRHPERGMIPARGTPGEASASMLLSRLTFGQHFVAFVRSPGCSALNSLALKI